MVEDTKQGSVKKSEDSSYKVPVLITLCVIILLLSIATIYLLCTSDYKRCQIYFVKDDRVEATLNKDSLDKKDWDYLRSYLGNDYKRQFEVLKSLQAERIIITPDQYASDLSDYYNGLIAVLAALLVILNIIAFFSLKTNAENELKSKLVDLRSIISKEVEDRTANLLLNYEPVHNRIQALLVDWMENTETETNNKKIDDIDKRLENVEKKYNDIVAKAVDQEVKSDKKESAGKRVIGKKSIK